MTNSPVMAGAAKKKAGFSGSAKSGTSDAWHMRATSVALVPLAIAFVIVVGPLFGKDYASVRAELGHPVPAILLLLFIVAGVFHMKIGMQSIIDDYVHEPHLKEWSLIGNLIFSASIAVACIYAVLRLSLA